MSALSDHLLRFGNTVKARGIDFIGTNQFWLLMAIIGNACEPKHLGRNHREGGFTGRQGYWAVLLKKRNGNTL